MSYSFRFYPLCFPPSSSRLIIVILGTFLCAILFSPRSSGIVLVFDRVSETLSLSGEVTDTPWFPSPSGNGLLAWRSPGPTVAAEVERRGVIDLFDDPEWDLVGANLVVFETGQFQLTVGSILPGPNTLVAYPESISFAGWSPQAKFFINQLPMAGKEPPLLMLPDWPGMTSEITAVAIPEPAATALIFGGLVLIPILLKRRRLAL